MIGALMYGDTLPYMSGDSNQMARDLEKVQQDLDAQRKGLDAMQSRIAKFLKDRADSLRGHKEKREAAPKVPIKPAVKVPVKVPPKRA